MKKLNILVVPAWFNHENRFEGIFIQEFCEALTRSEQKVTLLYIKTFSLSNFISYFKKIKVNFQTAFEVAVIKKINFYPNALFKNADELFKKSLLKKVIKSTFSLQIDIVHFQSLCNNLNPYLGYEIAKTRKIPYIVTEHYTNYKEANGTLFRPYLSEKFICEVVKNSSRNVAVSMFAANMFLEYFKSSFTTIPNIIAHSFFNDNFKKISVKQKFKLIFIGALSQRKGIMKLVESVKCLASEGKNVTLSIVGKGELMEDVQNFISKFNLSKTIFLLGRKTEKEIIDLLDDHHCLVLSSEMETFGLVIAESFLRGRPVIAMNSGAVSELINNNNGILYEKQSGNSNLVSAVARMIENYSFYDQEKIREEAILAFNESNIIRQYLQVYEEAIVVAKA